MIRRVRDCDKCGKTEIEKHVSLKVPNGTKPSKATDDVEPSLDEPNTVVVCKRIDLCPDCANALLHSFVSSLDIESGKKLIASISNGK